jgi:hypothetical protein
MTKAIAYLATARRWGWHSGERTEPLFARLSSTRRRSAKRQRPTSPNNLPVPSCDDVVRQLQVSGLPPVPPVPPDVEAPPVAVPPVAEMVPPPGVTPPLATLVPPVVVTLVPPVAMPPVAVPPVGGLPPEARPPAPVPPVPVPPHVLEILNVLPTGLEDT